MTFSLAALSTAGQLVPDHIIYWRAAPVSRGVCKHQAASQGHLLCAAQPQHLLLSQYGAPWHQILALGPVHSRTHMPGCTQGARREDAWQASDLPSALKAHPNHLRPADVCRTLRGGAGGPRGGRSACWTSWTAKTTMQACRRHRALWIGCTRANCTGTATSFWCLRSMRRPSSASLVL